MRVSVIYSLLLSIMALKLFIIKVFWWVNINWYLIKLIQFSIISIIADLTLSQNLTDDDVNRNAPNELRSSSQLRIENTTNNYRSNQPPNMRINLFRNYQFESVFFNFAEQSDRMPTNVTVNVYIRRYVRMCVYVLSMMNL